MPTLTPLDRPLIVVPVTAVPDGKAPTHEDLVSSAFCVQSGTAIRIYGKCTANGGKLYLLEHQVSTDNEWYPVDIDAKDETIEVSSSAPSGLGGRFSKWYFAGDRRLGAGSASYVLLYVTGGGGAVGDLTAWVSARTL